MTKTWKPAKRSPGTELSFKLKRSLLLVFLLLICSSRSFAVIPNTITSTFILTSGTTDACIGNCTVAPNCTLRIEGGATAIFTGNLTVVGNGVLIVNNGTVKMAPSKRIALLGFVWTGGGMPPPPFYGGRLIANNGLFTTSTAAQYWTGIEVSGGTIIGSMQARADLKNSTVEYADNGITNYNAAAGLTTTANGCIFAENTLFRNNRIRAARIFNAANINSVFGLDPNESGVNMDVTFTRCTFRHTDDFPYNPQEMVYLSNCRAIPFRACNFYGKNISAPYPYTIGINAVNSGLRAERVPGSPDGCIFARLRSGITVTNGMQVDRRPFVRNSSFTCNYGVNLSGCLNPLVVGNSFGIPLDANFFGVYLNNCTGYRVEGNTFTGDESGPGVVARNSGTLYNEIYRNQFNALLAGVQSIGINRSADAVNGLKIACNNLWGVSTGYDISVMQNPGGGINNGISRYQWMSSNPGGIGFIISAANRFNNTGSVPGYPYHHYYLQAGTNPPAQFDYRYYTPTATEQPVYRNFPTVLSAAQNTCAVHNAGGPSTPFPFLTYKTGLAAIESAIDAIEHSGTPDTPKLNELYQAQALLIDTISAFYQDKGDPDTLKLIYETVSKGYGYKICQAAAYAATGKYSNATALLSSLSGSYVLTAQETQQISNLISMYQIVEWLEAHGGNWAGMSPASLDLVYNIEASDAMFAGAIARSLRAQYEGIVYEPEFILPTEEVSFLRKATDMSAESRIYPNPATDQLFVRQTAADATLILYDVSGKVVWQQALNSNISSLSISQLAAGTYLAEIKEGTETTYRQKIVKQ